MDKFFIQNTFKTLDEIEEEMKLNKTQLKEDLEKPAVVELDMDELVDKYCGEIFDLGDKPVQIVHLVDFEGSFDSSVWKIIHLDGKYEKVRGTDLKPHVYKDILAEKLPKDLATAYYNAVNFFPSMKRRASETSNDANERKKLHFPQAMFRRVTTDFENSNYEDISKLDRNQIIKNYKNCKYKLRLLFNVRGTVAVIMWDKDDNLVTSPLDIINAVSAGSPLYDVTGPSVYSFNKLVKAADKIYVTDEDEHKIERSTSTDKTPEQVEIAQLYKKAHDSPYVRYYDKESDADLRTMEDATTFLFSENPHSWGNNDDTGDHTRTNNYFYKRDLQNQQQRYDDYMKSNAQDLDFVRRLKNQLQDVQYEYNKRRSASHASSSSINYNILRYKLLKLIAKEVKFEFNELDKNAKEAALLKNNRYTKALRKKEQLEAQMAELQAQLVDMANEIKKLSPDLDENARREFEEEQEQVFNDLYDKSAKYLDELEEYTNKLKDYKNKKAVKESLDNVILRIYTRAIDGSEEFFDDFNDEEEAKIKYNDLVCSNMYDQVCLVSICGDNTEILLDSQGSINENLDEKIDDKRSIGEIVDDQLKKEDLEKNSLTESKSFNLKDENDIIDASVYKTVGEEANEELVVVDPSVESRDAKFEPHIGDAIIQCKSCKTSLFIKPEGLVKDEASGLYNLDMSCPHCGAKNGFDYIAQAADKKETEDSEQPVNDLSNDVEKDEVENVEEVIDNAEDNNEPIEKSSLPIVETDSIDLADIDEVKNESFEKLINPYLTKLYENVKEFKTTNVKQTGRDEILIEGLLLDKNNKTKDCEFIFKTKENSSNSIVFEGYNKILTEQKNAFKLSGNVTNKELSFESFAYSYNKEIDGNQILIEGIEK